MADYLFRKSGRGKQASQDVDGLLCHCVPHLKNLWPLQVRIDKDKEMLAFLFSIVDMHTLPRRSKPGLWLKWGCSRCC